MYRCPFAANADSLRAIPSRSENYVLADSSSQQIRNYVSEIEFLPACNYCPGRSFDSPEIKPAIQVKDRRALPYREYKTTDK